MTPNPRPIPRFIADTTQEGIPHGRFAEQLREAFAEGLRGARGPARAAPRVPAELDWFPERAWGGRVWVPCSARTESEEGNAGAVRPRLLRAATRRRAQWVRSARPTSPTSSPRTTRTGRSTSTTTSIGRWRGENGRAGAVTLIWGRPLVRGAVAATAELDDRDRRPGRDHPGTLHPDRPRRARGLRRRGLRRGEALEPPGARARLREPLRGLTGARPPTRSARFYTAPVSTSISASRPARPSRASKVSSGSRSISARAT